MSVEHPLAYVLGLQGLALMRAFTGEYDHAFVAARLAEIRALLDDEELADAAVEVARVAPAEGYRLWAETYDAAPNAAFGHDEQLVDRLADGLPGAAAVLDAACGTGRLAVRLAGRGHRVVGVDASPDMLARAARRVPEAMFARGALDRLPVRPAAFDLVVCSLALTHVPELGPVMAEFARVLRPGGQLVIADVHPEQVARGSVPPVRGRDGLPGRIASHRHAVGDYLRAALAAGLVVRGCDEPLPPAPRPPAAGTGAAGVAGAPGPWHLWPWSLAALAPEAARVASAGVPAMLIWHFAMPGPPG
ncbi:class I SAM-dependent methyltransferase [Streptomyces marincola]|nr:class I SAM-dependent methyltransferase [Streptomyces marincola]